MKINFYCSLLLYISANMSIAVTIGNFGTLLPVLNMIAIQAASAIYNRIRFGPGLPGSHRQKRPDQSLKKAK